MDLRFLFPVVCAVVLVEASEVVRPVDFVPPPYLAAAKAYKEAEKTVLRLTPPELGHLPVTDPRRHYGLLVAVLSDLFQKLFYLCAPYEQLYYEAVDAQVPKAYDHTDYVGQQTSYSLSKLHSFLYPVLEVQQKECVNYTESQCNLKVHNRVENHPEKYQKPAEVLLDVGNLANVYLDNTYETVANGYRVLKLLTLGKDDLRSFAYRGASVYLKVSGFTAVDCSEGPQG